MEQAKPEPIELTKCGGSKGKNNQKGNYNTRWVICFLNFPPYLKTGFPNLELVGCHHDSLELPVPKILPGGLCFQRQLVVVYISEKNSRQPHNL